MHFITNPGGATHIVTEEEFKRLTSVTGFRAANEDEIARWRKRYMPARDPAAQAPGESADEPVLRADGGGAHTPTAAPGLATVGVAETPSPQSSTGDNASEGHSPTQQPGSTKAGGAPRGPRTRRRGSGV